jgi:solute carrier family 35 protein C2
MIKSSTPVWVLFFSFLLGFERPNMKLVGVIGFIVFGVFLTIDGEPHFNMHGFSLVSIAAVASGLRWNMTQLLMKKKNNDSSPLSTMYHTSPIMFVTMLSLSLYLEKQQIQLQTFVFRVAAMSIGGVLGNTIYSLRHFCSTHVVYILCSVHYDIVRTLFN